MVLSLIHALISCCCGKFSFSQSECETTIKNGDDSVVIDTRSLWTFSIEDNGILNNNRANHSFGNGNESVVLSELQGWGAVAPADGEIVSVTHGQKTRANGATQTFDITINGALVSPLISPVGNNVEVWSLSIPFKKGDVINVWTNVGDSGDDSVMSFFSKICI